VALLLALCAGCDGTPGDEAASSPNKSDTRVPVRQSLGFDRQAPGSENRSPVLSGASGTLRYRPGCLFLDDGHGGETGIVVPAHVVFDGERMAGKLKTPDGKQRVATIGEFVNLTGRLTDNPQDGRYSCKTQRVLIADYF